MINAHKTRSLRMLLAMAAFVTAHAFCSSANGQRGTLPRIQVTDSTKSIVIHAGSHYLLSFEYNVPDLWVGNQVVMSAVPMAPNEIMISGASPGITSLTVSDYQRRLQPITVYVKNDVRHLQAILDEQFQSGLIQVSALKTGVVLRGVVASQQQSDQAFEIAEDYYPGAVLNQLTLGGNQLVAINVRIYEVARSKLRQLGVDWSFFGDNVTAVQSVSGLIQQIGSGAVAATGQTLTFGVLDDDYAFDLFIKTLEQRSLAKLLDEPTLVTSNGRSAEFLSGGEIPIQINTNFGGTSVEYRSFGTKLDIVPTIHGQGELTLEVRAEVSDVASDLTGGNTPGFRVRRVNTGIRMKVGHTLALAGDYREETETVVRGIPGLMNTPVIGAMFRDTQNQTVETELVFLITPKFIDGVDGFNTPMPGNSSQSPTDHDLFHYGVVEVEPGCGGDECNIISPFERGNARAYPAQGTYPYQYPYAPNQIQAPPSNQVPNTIVNPPIHLAPEDFVPVPAPEPTIPQFAPEGGSSAYPPGAREPLLNARPVNLSDGTLRSSNPNQSNGRIVAPTSPSVTTDRLLERPVDPRPRTIPQAEPVPPESVPEIEPDEKFQLPNPFENRRSNHRQPTDQAINGPYGFSR